LCHALTTMRRLIGGSLLCACVALASPQTSIRSVDFKNLSYPWNPSSGWPHHLVWLNPSERHVVRLVNGRWRLDTEEESDARFSGLTLEAVHFAELTENGQTDAIVVLRFDTGGTQHSHYVYIWSLAAGRPKLMAYFHSGDRAASGLYRVYGASGNLVVELFDPMKSLGDCCSKGFVRIRYQWHSGKFSPVGAPEFGVPKVSSRLPVSAFGMHE
jgi:hypothetical protein